MELDSSTGYLATVHYELSEKGRKEAVRQRVASEEAQCPDIYISEEILMSEWTEVPEDGCPIVDLSELRIRSVHRQEEPFKTPGPLYVSELTCGTFFADKPLRTNDDVQEFIGSYLDHVDDTALKAQHLTLEAVASKGKEPHYDYESTLVFESELVGVGEEGEVVLDVAKPTPSPRVQESSRKEPTDDDESRNRGTA